MFQIRCNIKFLVFNYYNWPIYRNISMCVSFIIIIIIIIITAFLYFLSKQVPTYAVPPSTCSNGLHNRNKTGAMCDTSTPNGLRMTA